MTMMQRRTLLTGSLLGLGLAGCGFELRRPPVMPFRTILLTGFNSRSPLADELRRTLAEVTGVVDTAATAEVVLHALQDTRERSVVVSTAAGQVREMQLRVRFRFELSTPNERQLLAPVELLQTRDMSYNETAALAKEQEENQLYRVMQGDIVQQVMRRLAAVHI
jgi:LPS-assembly lipoprotein